MEFVVNEWLPEYFKPDSSNDEKEKLEKFLNKFMIKNDKLVVRKPSEFLRKIELYAKVHQNNNKVYNELKKFITNILLNSDKCNFIGDNEFDLPVAITKKLAEGGNTISDKYLFEAAVTTSSKTIITSDVKLKLLMCNKFDFNIQLLDDFLKYY